MHSIKMIKTAENPISQIENLYNHNFSRYSLCRYFVIQATADPQYRNKRFLLPLHPAVIYIFKREN